LYANGSFVDGVIYNRVLASTDIDALLVGDLQPSAADDVVLDHIEIGLVPTTAS
jgi:hypothetical protein